jgi:hypothetical protein
LGGCSFSASSRFIGFWSHKSWKIGGSEGRPFVAKRRRAGNLERAAGSFMVIDALSVWSDDGMIFLGLFLKSAFLLLLLSLSFHTTHHAATL